MSASGLQSLQKPKSLLVRRRGLVPCYHLTVQRIRIPVCRLNYGTFATCRARFLRKRAWRCVIVRAVEVELKSGFKDYAGLIAPDTIRQHTTYTSSSNRISEKRQECGDHEGRGGGWIKVQFKLRLLGNTLPLPSFPHQPSLHAILWLGRSNTLTIEICAVISTSGGAQCTILTARIYNSAIWLRRNVLSLNRVLHRFHCD
jgi:hypothetical protein